VERTAEQLSERDAEKLVDPGPHASH
jgi:hypothetical protein